MADIFTVDASVFVSAYNDYEIGHDESHQFLELLRARSLPLIEPMLLLPEVTAAIARVYQDAELATSVATNIKALPHLTLVPMNEAIADIAINVAAHQRLRGSDAVYAAVARRYNTTLVTLDQEQATRMGSVVTTQSPAAAVAALTVPDAQESAGGPEHAA